MLRHDGIADFLRFDAAYDEAGEVSAWKPSCQHALVSGRFEARSNPKRHALDFVMVVIVESGQLAIGLGQAIIAVRAGPRYPETSSAHKSR